MSLLSLEQLINIEEEVKKSIETYFEDIYLVSRTCFQGKLIEAYRKVDPHQEQICLLLGVKTAVNAGFIAHPKFLSVNRYGYLISPPIMELTSHSISVRLSQKNLECIINAFCDRFVSEMGQQEDAIPVFTCEDYKDIPCPCPSPCNGEIFDCTRRKGRKKLETKKYPILVFPLRVSKE